MAYHTLSSNNAIQQTTNYQNSNKQVSKTNPTTDTLYSTHNMNKKTNLSSTRQPLVSPKQRKNNQICTNQDKQTLHRNKYTTNYKEYTQTSNSKHQHTRIKTNKPYNQCKQNSKLANNIIHKTSKFKRIITIKQTI